MEKETKIGCTIGFGALIANLPFAWAFMFGIGMSSQPHRGPDTLYLLGVASDLLLFVVICTVPASSVSFAAFSSVNKYKLAWFVSVPYFLLLTTYVMVGFRTIS